MTGCATCRGRGLGTSAPTVVGAHSAVAGPGWHASAAPPTSSGMRVSRSVGQLGDLPDKARQLAGDGDRDGAAFLAASGVEVCPAAMEPELRAPRRVDGGGGLVV